MPVNTQNQELLDNLQSILEDHRSAFGRERSWARSCWMLLGTMIAFGRKTVSQLLWARGCPTDWTAFYRLFSRNRFSYDNLAECCLKAALTILQRTESSVVVFAIDITHVVRNSLTMPGTAWGKAPGTPKFKHGIARLQRFSHLAILSALEDGYVRAVPVRRLPAPVEKAAACEYPCRTE